MPLKHLTYSTFASYDHAEAENEEERFLQSMSDRCCPLCRTVYRLFAHRLPATSSESLERAFAKGGTYLRRWSLDLLLCPGCGWWHLSQRSLITDPRTKGTTCATWFELHHAVFSEIELGSSLLPIEDLRRHLARFWGQRKHMTAQQAEDLVASVLRDHYGGDVLRVTANANAPDGGIDLLMVSDGGLVRRAVQVKRRITHDVEPLEDVRNFIGAMLLSGNDDGVFVTTATRFSRNAAQAATNTNLARKRLNVELIDGEKILDLLENSNLRVPPRLPPLVDLDTEWIGDDGISVSTRKLMFGNLSRLFLNRS